MDDCTCERSARQESRGDKRRRELVGAACRLIAEKGFEGLRVRDIAAAAGVNIATLHYYFPEKEDLIRGVIEHILQQFISSNAPIANNVRMSAADQLQAMVANMEYRVKDHSEICVVLTEITTRAHRDAAIHQMMIEIESGWRSRLSSLIAAGHVDGSIPASTDPEAAASLLTAMFRGLMTQAVYRLDDTDFTAVAKLARQWIGSPQTPG
ncbi:TetR family transcriptional regulator [Capsulimonas corticalis]|uniref:TetR family transcriptional regulator n=1 Tax=Capsulimonas corticalis TaxID=2219043 RepID=A0A402CSP8_9BACT|nr:TetR/AcrR family transcriptional regulator [Capsulimonas corticalis]BDI31010.1 TetR family transcriptional regulator [Capsulimonas corticalis]